MHPLTFKITKICHDSTTCLQGQVAKNLHGSLRKCWTNVKGFSQKESFLVYILTLGRQPLLLLVK